jgi:hypothetical protein
VSDLFGPVLAGELRRAYAPPSMTYRVDERNPERQQMLKLMVLAAVALVVAVLIGYR